jgi:hypothetical protein
MKLFDFNIVRLSLPSINKNNKLNREKNREYLANKSSDFSRTKKFGINARNYIRKKPKINASDQGRNTDITQENKKIEGYN